MQTPHLSAGQAASNAMAAQYVRHHYKSLQIQQQRIQQQYVQQQQQQQQTITDLRNQHKAIMTAAAASLQTTAGMAAASAKTAEKPTGNLPKGTTATPVTPGKRKRTEIGKTPIPGTTAAATITKQVPEKASTLTIRIGQEDNNNGSTVSPATATDPTAKQASGSVEVHRGPPTEALPNGRPWPPGWIKTTRKRLGGLTSGQFDSYWHSPATKFRLRSMNEVHRFFSALEAHGGDERLARREFKNRKKKKKPEPPPSGVAGAVVPIAAPATPCTAAQPSSSSGSVQKASSKPAATDPPSTTPAIATASSAPPPSEIPKAAATAAATATASSSSKPVTGSSSTTPTTARTAAPPRETPKAAAAAAAAAATIDAALSPSAHQSQASAPKPATISPSVTPQAQPVAAPTSKTTATPTPVNPSVETSTAKAATSTTTTSRTKPPQGSSDEATGLSKGTTNSGKSDETDNGGGIDVIDLSQSGDESDHATPPSAKAATSKDTDVRSNSTALHPRPATQSVQCSAHVRGNIERLRANARAAAGYKLPPKAHAATTNGKDSVARGNGWLTRPSVHPCLVPPAPAVNVPPPSATGKKITASKDSAPVGVTKAPGARSVAMASPPHPAMLARTKPPAAATAPTRDTERIRAQARAAVCYKLPPKAHVATTTNGKDSVARGNEWLTRPSVHPCLVPPAPAVITEASLSPDHHSKAGSPPHPAMLQRAALPNQNSRHPSPSHRPNLPPATSNRPSGFLETPLRSIVQPQSNDVLLGKQKVIHPGNKQYENLVRTSVPAYLVAPPKEKIRIAANVVQAVRNRIPAGRFLVMDDATRLWNDVGNPAAISKTNQVLSFIEDPAKLATFLAKHPEASATSTQPRILAEGAGGALTRKLHGSRVTGATLAEPMSARGSFSYRKRTDFAPAISFEDIEFPEDHVVL